jgi:RimJ/RimL family protein N-acetyltransferase
LLETERLVLRLPRLDDAHDVLEFIADLEVMRWLDGETGDLAASVAKIERWLACWERDGVGHFAVERDGRVIGRVGFLVWDAEGWNVSSYAAATAPVTELGWAFAQKHWGHGYATEAAVAARTWGYEHTVGSPVSLIHPDNTRSMHVAEKLGATPTDTIEVGGKPVVIWRHGQLPAR